MSSPAETSPAVLRLNRIAASIARGLAVFGGVVVCAAAVVMTLSIVSRSLFGTQIRGDFEVVSVSSGVAILLFFPYCQATRSHITIGLFSEWLPKAVQRGIDAVWSLILAAAAAVVAWRVGVGVTEAWRDHTTTTLLQIPLVIVFIVALIATIGTSLLAAIDFILLLSADRDADKRDPNTVASP